MEHHKPKQEAKDRDIEEVKRLIDDGTLPLEQHVSWLDEGSKQNVLHLIAQSKSEKALKLLRGAPIDTFAALFTKDIHKRNPLDYAIKSGNVDMIQLLLSVAVRITKDDLAQAELDLEAITTQLSTSFKLSHLEHCNFNSPPIADVQLAELVSRARQAKRELDFSTAADGSCQFDALAIGLNQIPILGAGSFSADSVKQKIVDFIRNHQEDFAGFNEGDLNGYLNRVLHQNEWGTHLTLQAAADLFNINITVLSSHSDLPNILISPRRIIAQHSIVVAHFFELHFFGTTPLKPQPVVPVQEDITHRQLGTKILSLLPRDYKVNDRNALNSLSQLFKHLRLRGGANASDDSYDQSTVQGYIMERFHFAGLILESAFTMITTMVDSGLPEADALKNRNKRFFCSSEISNIKVLWKDFVDMKHIDIIDIGSACLPQIYGLLRWNKKNSSSKATFNVNAFDRSADWLVPFNICLTQLWKSGFNIKATLTVKDVVTHPQLNLARSKKLIISSFCVSENYAEGQVVPVLRNAAQLCEIGSVAYFQDRDIKGYVNVIEVLIQNGFVVIYEYKRTLGKECKEWGTEAQRPNCPDFEDKALYILCLIKIQ